MMNKIAAVKISATGLILLLAPYSAFALPKQDLIPSQWLTSSVSIDGSSLDWQSVPLNEEKKVAVDYAFLNDAEKLFVLFKLKDRKYLSSINFTGLTMWINPEGKKKKHYGITFQKKQVSAEFYLAYMEEQGQVLSEADKQKIRSMSSIIFYEASVSNKLSRSASQSPPTVEIEPAVFRIGSENRVMVYEIAVPLKRPLPDAAGVGCEPGGILKIGFEWGGMTDELRKKMIEQQMSSGRRTSGAADDWAHVNARGGSSVPRQSRNPKRHSFWVDVQLAELEK